MSRPSEALCLQLVKLTVPPEQLSSEWSSLMGQDQKFSKVFNTLT
jgi:hypothetical protein